MFAVLALLICMSLDSVWFGVIQGHSVTRKLNSSGGVESTQTLHNLDEG